MTSGWSDAAYRRVREENLFWPPEEARELDSFLRRPTRFFADSPSDNVGRAIGRISPKKGLEQGVKNAFVIPELSLHLDIVIFLRVLCVPPFELRPQP